MSTIKSTTGLQYTDMTGKVAAAQVSTASEKSAFNSFSDPAVTPLAPPITNHAAACAGPAIQASASFGSEDQRLLQITQAVVLRADSICAAAFTSGSYTRPTAQLETVINPINQCLISKKTDFFHHG